MRIGAIFARGSCRALKWMALFGLVFALGAGSALAQVTVTGPAQNTVMEGADVVYTVNVKGTVPVGDAGGTLTLTLNAPVGAAGNDATGGEDTDLAINQGLAVTMTVDANTGANATDRPFSGTGTIRFQTVHDTDAENENFTLTWALSDAGGVDMPDGTGGLTDLALGATPATAPPAALTIDDDETQAYVLELAADQTPSEGDVAIVTLKAVPDHVNASLELVLHSSDPVNYQWDNDDFTDGTVDPPTSIAVGPTTASVPAAGVGNSTMVYVQAPMNDKNRMTDTVTLTAHSGSPGDSMMQASLDISFADDHALAPGEAVTAVAMDKKTGDDAMEVMEVTEGGDPVYLTISVDRGKAADKDATTVEELTVDVKVAPAYAADATVTPSRVTFPAVATANGAQKADMMVELSALSDEDVGMEELMLDLVMMGDSDNGGGSSTGMFSIMIVDETVKKIMPKSEEDAYPAIEAAIEAGGGADGLNPEDSFEIMTSDLFTLMAGYTASYGASVEGDSVSVSVSGEMVMVEALTAGESMITVTGTAKEASSFQPSQTISNVADVTFPVMVTDKMLMVTVAADPMEIDEGGTSTITATANRAITAGDGDVMVDLDVIGNATLDTESITIAMGAMTGSAMLTAGEDEDYDNETVTVIASGSGIDGTMPVMVSVMDNDMAPPETTYTLTASADMVAEGDDAVTITATASAMVDEDTTIELAHGPGSASADDYSLDPMMITIAAGSGAGTAMLMATDDSDVEGDETLTLDGMMGNLLVGSVKFTITDNDMAPPPADPTVRAKDDAAMMIAGAISTAAGDADWMVGGMAATVDMSMLFEVDEGVSAAYSGVSSDNDVVRAMSSGTMLTLTPMSAGSSTITVTASDPASMDVATVSYDAMVALQTLVVTVSASADMVDEGGSVMVTASTNRAVTADTMLTLTVTGDTAAVSAPDMLTIAMGDDSGMAEVMAVEDDDTMNANVTVVVSGSALAAPVSLPIAVTDNDRTVNALTQAEVDAVFVAATAMASGGGDWVPGGNAADGRHEQAVLDGGRRHRRVHGRVVGRGHGHGERQRHVADADAGGDRVGHHLGDGHRHQRRR